MEMLPNSGGKPSWLETLLRWLPFIGIGALAFWGWGTISTFVAATLQSTLLTIVYGVPLAILVGSIVFNPSAWWMGYKSVCKWITSMFIKIDPLSYMDRYADILSDKLDNLNKTKVELQGRKVSSERRIENLKTEVSEHQKRGAAALKMNDQSTASLEGSRLQGALDSIKTYTPNFERLTRSCLFLDTLSENLGVTVVKLREDIERKREEFIVLRDEAKALGQAEQFIKGDTEEGRVYQESLKALEYNVTQKIAYVEDFEKRAEPILRGIQVDNKMHNDEGIAALEAFMKNPNALNAPSFKLNSTKVQDIQYEEVGEKKDQSNKFNLLD